MLWREFDGYTDYKNIWREIDNLNRNVSRFGTGLKTEFPAANVWMSGDNVMISAEIPGVDPKDVDISVTGSLLKLQGCRKPEETKEGEIYQRRERWRGDFNRNFELPFNVDANKVSARFSKGKLNIFLPCAEADKPKKISVKSE